MTKQIFADLHNHTTASDGDFSPEEMVLKAKKAGISVVGITDHDTDNGLDRAIDAGKRYGIDVVPGVEISVRFKRSFFTGTLHLLCYFAPVLLASKAFRRKLKSTLAKGRGEKLVRDRVTEINRIFGPKGKNPILLGEITFEQIAEYSSNATRRHFSLVLNEKHKIKDRDLINKIIGNNSPAYLPSGIDLDIVSAFIKDFPVISVLAHPAAGSFPGKGHYKDVLPPVETVEKLFPEFLDAGLDGLEINYPGHILEHRSLLYTWAKKYNLIVTGGSDCHDATERPPGVEGISEDEFKIFINKLRNSAK
ncbi:MAG: PHP domain-containing protein [Thermodesulfobacteriota bacterium]|nr:PHP domain-containing protein [Thermodesulfobacteriota bacterium]